MANVNNRLVPFQQQELQNIPQPQGRAANRLIRVCFLIFQIIAAIVVMQSQSEDPNAWFRVNMFHHENSYPSTDTILTYVCVGLLTGFILLFEINNFNRQEVQQVQPEPEAPGAVENARRAAENARFFIQ